MIRTVGLCLVMSGVLASIAFSQEKAPPTDAEKAARLFNLTGRRSKSYADCCIAAVAIRLGAPLATSNRDDFTPMVPHGLILA